jgi:hypothetical protein
MTLLEPALPLFPPTPPRPTVRNDAPPSSPEGVTPAADDEADAKGRAPLAVVRDDRAEPFVALRRDDSPDLVAAQRARRDAR